MNIIFKPECKTEIIKPTYDLPIIGEPISKTGASANNSNAYGVIVGIIGDGSSRRVRVMTEGYIDYDKVKENYTVYTEEAINALTGITLCSDGKLPSGSDPVLNNAKATGGIGWTESGEQTTIEWDGDTTGRYTPDGMFYLVSSVPFTKDEVVGATLTIVSGAGEQQGVVTENMVAVSDAGDALAVGEFCVAVMNDNTVFYNITFEHKGVYFVDGGEDGHISTLTYTAPDTVHKINEKYISGGGGADVVIKATYDNFGRNPVATLVAGSFNDLATKLSSFVPVTVHLVCETKDEDMGESYCLNVPCRVVATGDYSDITNISFITIEPWMENIAVCVPITTITFNSDNTVQAFTN